MIFPIGAYYVALVQTAQRTPFPADPLLASTCCTILAISYHVIIYNAPALETYVDNVIVSFLTSKKRRYH
jgi:hypothetical protein